MESSDSEMSERLTQTALNCDSNGIQLKEININVIPTKKSINNSNNKPWNLRTRSSYGLRSLERINWRERLNTRKNNTNPDQTITNDRKTVAKHSTSNSDSIQDNEDLESSEVSDVDSNEVIIGQPSLKQNNIYFQFLEQSSDSIVPKVSISNVTKILKLMSQKPRHKNRKSSTQKSCKKSKKIGKRRKLYSCGWDQCDSKKCQNYTTHHMKPIDC